MPILDARREALPDELKSLGPTALADAWPGWVSRHHADIHKLLRPGGFFLTNYASSPTAPMASAATVITTIDFDRQHNGDTLFWYQRH